MKDPKFSTYHLPAKEEPDGSISFEFGWRLFFEPESLEEAKELGSIFGSPPPKEVHDHFRREVEKN